MNGVQTRFKCKLDVKRCKRFVFPPSSLLPRSNALKTKAIRYFQTDRTLTRIVSPPLSEPRSEGYAASKGGIYSLTHALALSLSEWNITVNSIAPGWIQTHDYAQLQPEDHSQHPSRRVGKPEDIARMCLFLCEENNDFINGENITIDGGMTKKMIYIE